MNSNRVGVAAAGIGVFALGVRYGLSVAVERWVAGGFGGLVPAIGSPGQTAVVYTQLAGIVAPLSTVALAVGLGYYVGGRIELAREYRRLVGAVGAGSTAGVTLAATASVLAGGSSAASDGIALLLLAVTFASALVSTALPITVGALAGAALAHFRAADGAPPRSSRPETGSPPDPSDSRDGESRSRMRSTR